MGQKETLLTQQVKRYLHRRVDKAGTEPELLPGEMELAEQFGVSRVTVRSAIDELLREEYVIRLKNRRGLFTNPQRALDMQYIIGVVGHDHQSAFFNDFFAQILSGFSLEMQQNCFQLEMMQPPAIDKSKNDYAAILKELCIDALFWIVPDKDDIPKINSMIAKQYPVAIVLSPYLDTVRYPDGNFIRFDFARKGAAWAEFFLQRGLKNPIYCGGTEERIEGFRKTLRAAGAPFPDSDIIYAGPDTEKRLKARFMQSPSVDGIASDGTMYAAVHDFLKKNPDLAHLPVLFDGDLKAQKYRFQNPDLNIHSIETTYYQTAVKAGRAAAKTLLDSFQNHGRIQKGKSIKWI